MNCAMRHSFQMCLLIVSLLSFCPYPTPCTLSPATFPLHLTLPTPNTPPFLADRPWYAWRGWQTGGRGIDGGGGGWERGGSRAGRGGGGTERNGSIGEAVLLFTRQWCTTQRGSGGWERDGGIGEEILLFKHKHRWCNPQRRGIVLFVEIC